MPLLVGSLQDSDSTVREAAHESIVTIFTGPSIGAAAKSDLRKELMKKGVRKAMADNILRRVLGSGGRAVNAAGTVSMTSAQDTALVGEADSSKTDPHPGSTTRKYEPRNGVTAPSSSSASTTLASNAAIATPKMKAAKGERLLKAPKDMSAAAILADIEAQAAAAAAVAPQMETNIVEVVYVRSHRAHSRKSWQLRIDYQ